MKKAISILLTLVIMLSLCSCKKSDDSETAPINNSDEENVNDYRGNGENILTLNKTYSIENYAEITLFKVHTTDRISAGGTSIYYTPMKTDTHLLI